MVDNNSPTTQTLIESMARHLPPSGAELHLLDVNGEAGAILQVRRADLHVSVVPGNVTRWPEIEPASVDAVVALDYVLNSPFLEKVLDVMRPGGRLIVVQSHGQVSETPGKKLESAGYARILVEPVVDSANGVLIRGEKAHTDTNTWARIRQVVVQESVRLDLATYRGHYVYLLIKQTPNLPAWKRQPDDPVEWHAITLEDDQTTLLAFSSLPKAVAFMQPAVTSGRLKDVNKVAKFSREAAATWVLPVRINPGLSILDCGTVSFVAVDPDTAEVSDE